MSISPAFVSYMKGMVQDRLDEARAIKKETAHTTPKSRSGKGRRGTLTGTGTGIAAAGAGGGRGRGSLWSPLGGVGGGGAPLIRQVRFEYSIRPSMCG